ncbi:permease [Roseibium sp. AS2]|uniref:permease n=1 Tax=Roseibium sp. AS2 TaxID=3135781 RepID=UPI00317CEA69
MDAQQTIPKNTRRMRWGIAAAAGLALSGVSAGLWPHFMSGMAMSVILGLGEVAPIVVFGIVLTAWIIASGADSHVAGAFETRTPAAIVIAAAIGALTPVCGVTVLPLMTGLLAAGIPLAPVMAFWLSSPVTDPAMLATTAATLGLAFAVGKTLAAFALGIYGGAVTAALPRLVGNRPMLRDNALARNLAARRCGSDRSFAPRIWRHKDRRHLFAGQAVATTRLILLCLIPAFAAEYALNAAVTPGSLAAYAGADKWWSIPAAVLVGAPAYIDGYAALPLTRGLIDNGMSPGAAMAFLVSGGVVSIWGALAIFPVLALRPFLLYLLLAVSGSLFAGYAFEWLYQGEWLSPG